MTLIHEGVHITFMPHHRHRLMSGTVQRIIDEATALVLAGKLYTVPFDAIREVKEAGDEDD